jgi:hypothetical protein
MKRALTILFAIVAAFVLFAWRAYSKGAEVYVETPRVKAIALQDRFRTWAEHDAIIGKIWPKPYVVELDRLVFYGAHHTSRRDDPQFPDIEQRWQSFKPTVALCEGRSRGTFVGPLFGRLGKPSEVRLVHELARRDGVRLLTLEPDYADEVAGLLTKWTPEQVALFFTMRVYWQEAGGKPDESLARDLLAKRTDVAGLRGSLRTLADVDRAWKRDFPSEPDWRSIKGDTTQGYLAAIADDSRRIRGEHMARTLIDLHRRGERVFAVVGSGNVIRIERIVRKGWTA